MTPTTDAPWSTEPLGDRCLLLRLGDVVDAATIARVHAVVQRLRDDPIAGVTDMVPAFNTVALHYQPAAFGTAPFDRLRALLHQRLAQPLALARDAARTVEVPVCYGSEFGPDLDDVAQRCGLTPEAVVAQHLGADHRVAMLGFAPGLPFITGLGAALAMPRRSTPRTHVPPGSVAIAREQTVIYPLDTPGGWNILGRTPLRLFDPQAQPPCLLAPGDRIRFVRIDAAAFQAAVQAAAGGGQ